MSFQRQIARAGLGQVPAKGSKDVFELDYDFVPTPGFLIRPNVQYILSFGRSAATNCLADVSAGYRLPSGSCL